MQYIIPGSEPFYFHRGSTGCLLMHGFSSTPEEMLPLGEFLASHGMTVYGVRLAGHATQPSDMNRVRWTDWLCNVEDGIAFLSACDRKVLIGQSMGGMIALTAAAQLDVSAVITLSTPYGTPLSERLGDRLQMIIHPVIRKSVARFPPHHPLYHRRELNYPAYPEIPARILSQVNHISQVMLSALPRVSAPALLIHSRADQAVPFSCLQNIYDHISSSYKEMLPLDGMDHSLVCDPQHQVVFDAILNFLSRL